jgi:uncharacterized membrane protein YphA (DoxX/SURF4 family)
MWLVQTLVSAFLAILFIQSGLDKVFDFKGNLDWLKGHFSKSFLAGTVPALLLTITVIELLAGLLSAFGIVTILLKGTYCVAFAGTVVSALALIMLFFGQRVAKDYAGAASLVSYFILVIIDLYFLV